MRQERHVNNAMTTLDGAIAAGTLAFDVVDGSVFPSEGDFRILVESELMLVTSRDTNELTVERGIESTIAIGHNSGSTVCAIVTEGSLEKHMSDYNALYIPGEAPPFRIFDAAGALAGEDDFDWFYEGSATVEDLADGTILMTTPGGTLDQWTGKYMACPTPPYTVTAAFSVLWRWYTGYPRCGIVLGQDEDEKQIIHSFHHGRDGYNPGLQIGYTDTYTHYDGDILALRPLGCLSEVIWLRFQDTGSDPNGFKFYLSVDGVNWLFMAETHRTTGGLTDGGDRIGFGHDRAGNTGSDHFIHLKHWSFD